MLLVQSLCGYSLNLTISSDRSDTHPLTFYRYNVAHFGNRRRRRCSRRRSKSTARKVLRKPILLNVEVSLEAFQSVANILRVVIGQLNILKFEIELLFVATSGIGKHL